MALLWKQPSFIHQQHTECIPFWSQLVAIWDLGPAIYLCILHSCPCSPLVNSTCLHGLSWKPAFAKCYATMLNHTDIVYHVDDSANIQVTRMPALNEVYKDPNTMADWQISGTPDWRECESRWHGNFFSVFQNYTSDYLPLKLYINSTLSLNF
jgi:hypothetical protein